MSVRTYSHYGTPDAVAGRWTTAIAMHQKWVASCFKDFRDGKTDLETLERRCQIHALGPIDDATHAETIAWAEEAACSLGLV
jgi:hypothetical protein